MKNSSILVITAWILSILTAFAVTLGYVARSHLHYASHLQERVRLYYLARAGIDRALVELDENQEEGQIAFNHPFLNNQEIFKNIILGQEGLVSLKYKVNMGDPEKKEIFYGIEDESSRIDINNASVGVLAVMLERKAGMEREEAVDLAEYIDGWRRGTKNQEVKDYYQKLDLPYENKGAKFEALEELLLVKGMTSEIFSTIKDIITVYDTERVNINTAGFDVFYALGLDERLIERVIQHRRGPDRISGTDKDNVFKDPGDLLGIGFMFSEDSIQIKRLIREGILKTSSDTFRVNSLGHFGNIDADQISMRKIVSVFKFKKEQAPKMLYWHEN